MSNQKKIPVSRAILWILLSTLFISGSAFMGGLYFLHIREKRSNDEQYRIVALIQRTSQADALKTGYLAELLDLSLDSPINLYHFNTQKATDKLSSHPLIKEVSIKKILPGTLYIDYQLRTPHAYVGELSNTAIDEEGVLFPFHPFFTPKKLPTLYLGLDKEKYQWGNCIGDELPLQHAFYLLDQWQQLFKGTLDLKQIDVMQAEADSYGQRQIVLKVQQNERETLTSGASPPQIFLRLSSDHTAQDLLNFQALLKAFDERESKPELSPYREHNLVVDLRIANIAFLNRLGGF